MKKDLEWYFSNRPSTCFGIIAGVGVAGLLISSYLDSIYVEPNRSRCHQEVRPSIEIRSDDLNNDGKEEQYIIQDNQRYIFKTGIDGKLILQPESQPTPTTNPNNGADKVPIGLYMLRELLK